MRKCDQCDRPAKHSHPYHEDIDLCESCYQGALCTHYHVDTFEEALEAKNLEDMKRWKEIERCMSLYA